MELVGAGCSEFTDFTGLTEFTDYSYASIWLSRTHSFASIWLIAESSGPLELKFIQILRVSGHSGLLTEWIIIPSPRNISLLTEDPGLC